MNRSWRKAAAVTVSLLLMGGVAACGSNSQAGGSNAANGGNATAANAGSGSSADVIKIGEIGAFSGDLASLGTWDNQGLQLAVDQINAKGGIHGKKVEIVKLDDQGSPSVAVNDAKKLIGEGIVAAIATPESTTTLATIPVFAAAKIPQLTAGESPDITKKGSQYIFRYDASSDVFNKTLVDFVVNQLGYKRIAMITNSGGFGQGNHTTFLQDLKDHGLTPVADEVVSALAERMDARARSWFEACDVAGLPVLKARLPMPFRV
ncbi:MAG: ABC transporter substrate-binding protein, partial [Alicyclobacillus sp.]|nr:ABC transporter substrate-binding protein [Alicyclobacillus sp.]